MIADVKPFQVIIGLIHTALVRSTCINVAATFRWQRCVPTYTPHIRHVAGTWCASWAFSHNT